MTNFTITACLLLLAGPADASQPENKSSKLPASAAPAAETEATPATAADAPATESVPAEPVESTEAPPPTAAMSDAANTSETADPFEAQPAAQPNEPPPAVPATPASTTAQRSARVYPDRPIDWRLDIVLGIDSTVVTDSGYLAFDDNDSLLGFDLGARWDYRFGKRFFLGPAIHYSLFQASRSPYEGLLSTELVVHEPTVHVRGSVMTVEGVDVFADLGGGPSIVLDTVSSEASPAEQRRSVTGAFAAVGGVSLYLPKRWLRRKGASRVTAGIETSFGYQFRGRIDVSTDRDLGDEPLPSATADFGDFAMRGFVWRLGLFVRVM